MSVWSYDVYLHITLPHQTARPHHLDGHTPCILWAKQMVTTMLTRGERTEEPRGRVSLNFTEQCKIMYKLFLCTQWSSDLYFFSFTLPTTVLFTFCTQDIYLKGKDGGYRPAILNLTSNVGALCAAEAHMVGGGGSGLIEQELITALLVGFHFVLVSVVKSWEVYGALASHGSAKTQRGGLTAPCGAGLSSQTSGCGLFMYFVSGLLTKARARAQQNVHMFMWVI